MKNQNNNSALYTLITVFFFWGFFGASNGVFIPFCKTYFKIDQFQAQLVEFAFYGAYFIGALILEFSSILIFLGLFLLLVFYSLSKEELLAKRNPMIKESENFHY